MDDKALKKLATDYINQKYCLYTDQLKQVLISVYIEAYRKAEEIRKQ